MARKKKKIEDDAWMWLTQSFVPGQVQVSSPLPIDVVHEIVDSLPKKSTSLPYEVDPYRLRQLFNFPAYFIYAAILPSPLEQIAFAKDPLGITPPYEWRGGFHALLDVAATVSDPIGVARSKLVNPYQSVHGKPDPNYWNTAEGQGLTELFASRT